jgi:hypothetical protein
MLSNLMIETGLGKTVCFVFFRTSISNILLGQHSVYKYII